MKTKLLSFAFLMMAISALVALPSCKSENEKNFLGLWRSGYTETEDNDTCKITAKSVLCMINTEDGIQNCSRATNYTVEYHTETPIVLNFTVNSQEKYAWKINGDDLTETPTDINVSVTNVTTNINDKSVERQLLNSVLKDMMNELVKEAKEDFYSDSGKRKIASLSPTKYVQKEADSDDILEWHR